MYLTYGNTLTFTAGEAWPVFFGQQRRYNPRGMAQSVVKTMQVEGTIIASGQAAINTRVGQILTALELEGGSAIFHMDTGADTHIALPSAGSRGVRILQNTLTMEEGKAHFATGLPFSITFEAEYPIADLDPYVEYQETITRAGTGGPRKVWQELDFGVSIEQIVSTNTPVTYTQQGFAVGASGYPPFPPAIYGYDDPDNSISYDAPQRDGLVYINFPIRWNYRKTVQGNQGLQPPNYP